MAHWLTLLRAKLAWLLFITCYRVRMVRIAFRLAPLAGAEEPDPDPDPDPDPNADPDPANDPKGGSGDPDPDPDPEPDPKAAPDWKRMARKHEREAKKARDEAQKLADQLKAREDADKSEHEKAVDEAATTARAEARTEFEKERRKDRLELATTKIAAKGLSVGSGDDAKTVRFADPDDALLHLERDIRNGDLDEEDVFDKNGRVNSSKLEDALTDLLERKPHLAADSKPKKVSGSADAGKGGGPASTEGSVDKELDKIRRHSSERVSEGAKFRRAA